MKQKSKSILKCIMTFVLTVVMVMGALPLPQFTMVAQAATTTSTISVDGTDYTLFSGFTVTDGNGNNWANLVDGNTSTSWIVQKTKPGEPAPDPDDPPAPTGDFAGGTEDPAFVEFHADAPIIPKGYVLTCHDEDAGFWKPVQWALKARLNEGDEWTTIHSSNTTLGAGKTFEIACSNDGDNEYQYFRFEVYEVGTTYMLDLDELQFYGSVPAYTHLTVKAATCMATGIKRDCYRRNSDGKYFTDETGVTELAESNVIAPIISHTGVHHEATDVNIEYWQCSMCSKYFSSEECTTEITEEQTKIYRTITIDNSISGLVRVDEGKTQALAGGTVLLRVLDDRIDISTLKVNDGAVEVVHVEGVWYKFTMPAADVTVTAEVAQSNVDGDILTGSIKHRVTITDGASITLSNATISGSIVCEGSATITLVGTNSVSAVADMAGIQIGGSGTTLTIKGDGSLTANGGNQSAGIGLSRAWDVDNTGGNIVIEGGNITATGGSMGAGIGLGVAYDHSPRTITLGNITIKGGSVTATGGDQGKGIGTGYVYGFQNASNIGVGTITITTGIDRVEASSISESITYMRGDDNVTASKSDYFTIIANDTHLIIVQKVTPAIADIPDQTYTGSEITPEPQVMAGSLSLNKGTDYEYSYENNVNVGEAKVTVTFKGDYESLGSVEQTFNITKAAKVPNAPETNIDIEYTTKKVSDVTLPEGWIWADSDKDKNLIVGENEITAVYNGKDKGNYETESVKILITRAACKHEGLVKTEAVDPTCTEEGNSAYWHCPVCEKYFSDENGNNEIEKDSWILTPRHKWDEGVVTKEPTSTEPGVKTFTCTECKATKTEEISPTGKSDTTKPTEQSSTEAKEKDNKTTFSIKNKAKVKKTAKIKIKDKDKIKKITLNGKKIKIKSGKTSFTLKLKSFKKKLKKKGKWNTLVVVDAKGNKKTLKFKTK